MNERFTIWNFADVPKAYVPDTLLKVGSKLALRTGVSFADQMPQDMKFTADPDYPDDFLMLDSFGNTQSVIPISPRLKAFLEAKGIPRLEFLPVDLLDHGGKVIANYFLLHSTQVIDAIDKTQTELEVDDLNEQMFSTVENLTLLDERIPPETQIFRVKGLYDVTCVSRELAREIDALGFTGIEWEETSEYSY